MTSEIVAFEMSSADLALRAAASALLLLHLVLALTGGLAPARRFTLAGFVASILSYMLCSHPAFFALPNPWWAMALCFCLMSAPLLWLLVQQVFDDAFAWQSATWVLLVATLLLGWAAILDVGGMAAKAAHKLALISYGVATVWTVLRDWQTDLVAQRRHLRTWVTGMLGGYVLVVLLVELVFIGGVAPQGLMLLHLAGIALASGWMAWVFARHPAQEWLGRLPPKVSLPEPLTPLDTKSLTPPPPTLDRKADLEQRALQIMSVGRAYAQEGLTLAQLAHRLEASPAQLRETIHHGLGYRNFNDFLHHYRVDEAAQRMLVQDLPILSIALDVGYGSIGPFNRAFKRINGVTPSEWRARRTQPHLASAQTATN